MALTRRGTKMLRRWLGVERRGVGVGSALLLFGGGLLVGAGAVFLLAPRTRDAVREGLSSTWQRARARLRRESGNGHAEPDSRE